MRFLQNLEIWKLEKKTANKIPGRRDHTDTRYGQYIVSARCWRLWQLLARHRYFLTYTLRLLYTRTCETNCAPSHPFPSSFLVVHPNILTQIILCASDIVASNKGSTAAACSYHERLVSRPLRDTFPLPCVLSSSLRRFSSFKGWRMVSSAIL